MAHRLPTPPLPASGPIGRADALRLLDWLVGGHLPYLSDGGAGLDLGFTAAHYDDDAARLEGLSRLLWGVAPAVAGGGTVTGIERIVAGLIAGTDPGNPAFWGGFVPYDQRFVEMAAIAVAMRDAPHAFFDPLPPAAKENLCRWLETIARYDIPGNNWRFFRVLTLDALDHLGWPVDRAIIAREIDFIDELYIGDGWYRDGRTGTSDYYNGFALHYYALVYARWRAADDPDRAQVYIDRARAFADTYLHWFGDDGAPIAYGRSLTYRFATVGFWGLLAEVGHPAISAGRMRDLWSRSMLWWTRRPILDPAGRITIGYAYPNLLMQEFYNSPQSPLWALKAFYPLQLPADHPFWTEEPRPFAPETAGYVHAAALQIVRRRDGDAYLITGRSSHEEHRGYDGKYNKFAYSSAHGPCVEAERWLDCGFAGDNILALRAEGTGWRFRDTIREGRVEDGALTTRWSPFPGCAVETRQRFTDAGEAREHRIVCDRPVDFVATGHAVDLHVRRSPLVLDPLDGEPETSVAVGATLVSDIRDRNGRFRPRLLSCAPNTNLMFPHAAVPALTGRLEAGEHTLATDLTYGRRGGVASGED